MWHLNTEINFMPFLPSFVIDNILEVIVAKTGPCWEQLLDLRTKISWSILPKSPSTGPVHRPSFQMNNLLPLQNIQWMRAKEAGNAITQMTIAKQWMSQQQQQQNNKTGNNDTNTFWINISMVIEENKYFHDLPELRMNTFAPPFSSASSQNISYELE